MSDLPPVGELVQITDISGRTMLAVRRGPAETMYSATQGLLMGREDVASWCRVLVVPDGDVTVDLIARAVHDKLPGYAGGYTSTAHHVLAAVRGLAIR